MFLNSRNVKLVDIHCHLVEIYGENIRIDEMLRKWARPFNDQRSDVHDESWSRASSVVNDGLVRKRGSFSNGGEGKALSSVQSCFRYDRLVHLQMRSP
ncbi:hypothetical protein TNCV_2134211 [Trichonephila clavipes]|nr:hypothetical protein TNCV_2134211 [Trichonephila clavipes]